MRNNFKFTLFFLGIVILGLTYSGSLQAYALDHNPPVPDVWNLSANPNYVNTSLKISCVSTNPDTGGDTDGDGICDNWENGHFDNEFGSSPPNPGPGLHIRFHDASGLYYTYDLSCGTATGGCPSFNHKDVYLELDWMTGHMPDTNVIPDVVSAFGSSPTTNLDGNTGIRLHIQRGENPTDTTTTAGGDVVEHKVSLKFPRALANTEFWMLKQNRFGTIPERNTGDSSHHTYCANGESSQNCLTAKRQVFHYMVFIHQLGDTGYTTSSGYSEIGGNDAVVSLGSFPNGVGNIDQQEAGLMHELGHNLGLYHGGGVPPDVNSNGYDQVDDNADNCKPDYLSVMSYTYEFRTIEDLCRPLDYSGSNIVSINAPNENPNSLTDTLLGSYKYPSPYSAPSWIGTLGLGNPPTCFTWATGHERPIYFSGPTGSIIQGQTGTTGDWNQGSAQQYSQNINNLPTICPASTYLTTLSGHDDWRSPMTLVFIQSGLGTSGKSSSEGSRGASGSEGVTGPTGSQHIEIDQSSMSSSSGASYSIQSILSNSATSSNSAVSGKNAMGCETGNNVEIGYLYPLKKNNNQTQIAEIVSDYGGLMMIDKSSFILMPSSYSPLANLTSIANEIGGKFIPEGQVFLDLPDPKIYDKPITAYKIPGEQGNPYESACAGGHVELTSDQLGYNHFMHIQELNQSITVLPDSAFKDKSSGKILHGYIDDAFTANSNNEPWKVVYYLSLLKAATDGTFGGDSSDDLITSKEAQKNIYSAIQENIDRFTIEGTTTNATPNPVIDLQGTPNNNAASLTWKEKEGYFGPTVVGYQIERNSGVGFVTISQNTPPDKTQYTDPDLKQGTFTYRVSPINSLGKVGNPSNEVSVVIINNLLWLALITGAIMIGVIIAEMSYVIWKQEKAGMRS